MIATGQAHMELITLVASREKNWVAWETGLLTALLYLFNFQPCEYIIYLKKKQHNRVLTV